MSGEAFGDVQADGEGGSEAQAGDDFGGGPAAMSIVAEAMTHDVEKGLGNGAGDDGVSAPDGLPGGEFEGERLDEDHAEGPDIAGGGGEAGGGFGRIVGAEGAEGVAGFADGGEAVEGEFDLAVDEHDVGGLEAGVDDAAAVEKEERFENGIEHLTGFGRVEGAEGKNLGKIFVGEFGDGVIKASVVEGAFAGFEKAEDAGVRKFGGELPAGELNAGVGSVGGDEFDGGFFFGVEAELGLEDGGLRGRAEEGAKGIIEAGHLAHPFLCRFHHCWYDLFAVRGPFRQPRGEKQKKAARRGRGSKLPRNRDAIL